MKTKRRAVNSDTKTCNKKIVTRNMQNKMIEDKVLSVTTSCQNNSPNKSSPKTRAKSSIAGKLEFDPYLFSKLDEECKLPLKKMKITEKNSKDVSVNTRDFTSMTDPMLLGPCEPGTSIELRGIVWLETATGLLVINVTWRGRTYVGTLLDSTKYEFTPSFSSQDVPAKFENNQTNRPNRGRKRYAPLGTTYQNDLRSNSIRHSRRLSESQSYLNSNKKSSTRLEHNDPCYVDSFSLSAEASFSGESDNEFTNYHKFSPTNKTRSVTRSLAKQTKVGVNETDSSCHEADNFSNSIKCTQKKCFKQFIDNIALQYHLQRSHGVFEETIKTEKLDNGATILVSNESIKLECMEIINDNNTTINGVKQKYQRINGQVETKNDTFEFNSDADMKMEDTAKKEVNEEREETVNNTPKKRENENNQRLELSVHLPASSEVLSDKEELESPKEDKERAINPVSTVVVNDPQPQPTSNIPKIQTTSTSTDPVASSGYLITQSNPAVRVISAPIVSVPFEASSSVTSTSLISNSNLSPTLIRPKPSAASCNISFNSQLKKLKPTKTSFHNDDNLTSFQIPSTTTLSKKRPLIPLKVSSNLTTTCYQNRIISSSSSLNSLSPNQPTRHSRPSIFTNVTPILPATCNTNNASQIMSSSILSTGSISVSASVSTSFNNNNNNQIIAKRAIVTSNNISPSGMTSLLSLKPIQPKPKSSSILPTYSNPTTSTFSNSVQTVNLPGILPTQASYQRQILPSPMSKIEISNYCDDKLFQKSESIPSTLIKKKRRKPDKKLRLNFHECNRLKKLSLNPIQPKHGNEYKESSTKNSVLPVTVDSYKMDEENSHSPGYSDLSETNDTPAPILEKEIELKSGDCDKLVICTDFDTVSVNRISSSGSDNYDENKDNKPPALMPAVLSTDLLNGSTNDIDLSESPVKTGRKKLQAHRKSPNVSTDTNCQASLRHNTVTTSSRRSFQSSAFDDKIHLSSVSSPKISSLYKSTENDQIPKLKFPNKYSNLSAINDYVWLAKNNHDQKTKILNKCDKNINITKVSQNEDCSKKIIVPAQTQQSNGKFSVQALTSPQEIVSRSFPSSSTVISLNPNTKLASTLFKN